jgi:hypothetical protein
MERLDIANQEPPFVFVPFSSVTLDTSRRR